jgi:Nnf1
LKDYNVKENIDTLHTVVTEAAARKEREESGQDVWRDGLQPQEAVRARAVPLLEAEVERLRAMLKGVSDCILYALARVIEFLRCRWRRKAIA